MPRQAHVITNQFNELISFAFVLLLIATGAVLNWRCATCTRDRKLCFPFSWEVLSQARSQSTPVCGPGDPWNPFRMLLYCIEVMCLCLKWNCLNRNFFCLNFYSFNIFFYQPFKKLPLYSWELSTALYTLFLETEFLFREVQLLSGFNLAIEREIVVKTVWKRNTESVTMRTQYSGKLLIPSVTSHSWLTILTQLLFFKVCLYNEDCFQFHWDVNVPALIFGLLESGLFWWLLFYAIQERFRSEQ